MTTKLHEDEEIFEHDSYGMIGISRSSGRTGPMFGSPLRDHWTTIRIRLYKAERIHHQGTDRFFGNKVLTEVELTAAQFAEMITTPNVAFGVPCTIRHLNGKDVPTPPDTPLEVEKARTTFAKEMRKFTVGIREKQKKLSEMLAERKTLTQENKKELLALLDSVVQQLESNAPYAVEVFQEATEKVMVAAKSEIDSFVTSNVMAAGMHALAEELNSKPPYLPADEVTVPKLPENTGSDGE